jgi:hypothetical protein
MTGRLERKSALAAYRERKQPAGIFAVRCAGSSRIWIDHTTNVDAIRNRLWFTLRMGSNTNGQMQADWKAFGETSFSFETLEAAPEDATPYERSTFLKERTVEWVRKFDALPV